MKRFNERFDFSLKDAAFIAGIGWVLLFMAAGAGVLHILMGSGTWFDATSAGRDARIEHHEPTP